jgi:membrane-associated phospholipid phosphatase
VHIYLNQFVGKEPLDLFFYYITYLGDGIIMPFLLAIIMLYNLRVGLYATIAFITATLITTALKYIFFDDVMRPYHIFQWYVKAPITYFKPEELHTHNSFPSGHATQVFAILMSLVLTAKKQSYKFLFFFIAVLSAFSRVYLSQHWLVDITAGSIIGTTSSICYYNFFFNKNAFEKLNKPLLKLRKPRN